MCVAARIFSKKQALNINEARCSFITISADWIHTVIHYSVTPTFFNAKAKYSSNVISWFNSFSHHSLLCSQTVKPSISTEAAAFSIASFLVHMINHSLISVCIYIKIALVKPVFFTDALLIIFFLPQARCKNLRSCRLSMPKYPRCFCLSGSR